MSVDDESDSDLRKNIRFENFQLFCWITIKTIKHPVFGYWTRRNILPGVPPPPREAKEMVLQRREKRAPPSSSFYLCHSPFPSLPRIKPLPPFQFQTTVCSPPFLFFGPPPPRRVLQRNLLVPKIPGGGHTKRREGVELFSVRPPSLSIHNKP